MKNVMGWKMLFLMVLMANPVRGDLQISLSDIELYNHGLGSIDVLIRSDTGFDVLDAYSMEFAIGSGGLEFIDQQLDSHLWDPNYIFYNNSQATEFPPASSVLESGTRMLTFDATHSGPPYGVQVPTTDRLLARLNVRSLGEIPGILDVNLVGTLNLLVDDNTFVTSNLQSQLSTTTPTVDLSASDLTSVITVRLPDFDVDGDVDGSDFLSWQLGNSPNPSSGQDLTGWRGNFGNNSGTPSIEATIVPEPGTWVMLFSGILAIYLASIARSARAYATTQAID